MINKKKPPHGAVFFICVMHHCLPQTVISATLQVIISKILQQPLKLTEPSAATKPSSGYPSRARNLWRVYNSPPIYAGFWGCQPFKAGSFTGGVVFLSSLPFYQCFFIYKSQLKYRAPYRARYRKIRYSADSGATAASKISVTALSGASVKRDTATARIVPMIKPGTIS